MIQQEGGEVSSHVLADFTGGLKIGVGFLREDSRLAFHSVAYLKGAPTPRGVAIPGLGGEKGIAI